MTKLAAALARPAVVVAGDYSAGKSSFIKRMFTEFGIEVPASLHIRADATTDDVHRYEMGRIDIVDTPGFQSRRPDHDDLALAGVRDAALVVVVLAMRIAFGRDVLDSLMFAVAPTASSNPFLRLIAGEEPTVPSSSTTLHSLPASVSISHFPATAPSLT